MCHLCKFNANPKTNINRLTYHDILEGKGEMSFHHVHCGGKDRLWWK